MCFSATASFTAGIGLSAVGGVTLSKVKRKEEALFASIPLLFGIQQLTEGVIWLSFAHPMVIAAMSRTYLLFSHILWPTVIPLSFLLMESVSWRRKVLAGFVGIGVIVSAYFVYFFFTESITTHIVNASIQYLSPHFCATSILSPYSLATCASCLFSSHRFARAFGISAFLAAIVAYTFYYQTLVSVWCFFAAVLSLFVYLHFRFEQRVQP